MRVFLVFYYIFITIYLHYLTVDKIYSIIYRYNWNNMMCFCGHILKGML